MEWDQEVDWNTEDDLARPLLLLPECALACTFWRKELSQILLVSGIKPPGKGTRSCSDLELQYSS